MAKGADAKLVVAQKIAKAFGNDWIGEYDKKYYVWSTENGERMQVAISMTCPKVPVGEVNNFDTEDDYDFENMPPTPTVNKKVEITAEETKNIEDLMARLGL